MSNRMPITTDDLLEAIMKAAIQPQLSVTTDHEGKPIFGTNYSPVQSIVDTTMRSLMMDEAFKAKLAQEMEYHVSQIAAKVAERMPDSVFIPERDYRQNITGYKIEKWMAEALQEALAEALRPAVVAYVTEHFNVGEIFDDRLKITVNVEVRK